MIKVIFLANGRSHDRWRIWNACGISFGAIRDFSYKPEDWYSEHDQVSLVDEEIKRHKRFDDEWEWTIITTSHTILSTILVNIAENNLRSDEVVVYLYNGDGDIKKFENINKGILPLRFYNNANAASLLASRFFLALWNSDKE